MATYTIFGTAPPSGGTALAPIADSTTTSLSTCFKVTGVTGWRVKGIRIYMPPTGITVAPSGQVAYLWSATTTTPDTIRATANFTSFVAGAWNTVLFATPFTIVAGTYYWAQVYLPTGNFGIRYNYFGTGSLVSVDTPSLFAAGTSETPTGNGSYVLGAAGQAPANSATGGWYGVDVLVDNGIDDVGLGEAVGIVDAATAVRSGLPTTVHGSATATDVLGLSTAATGTFSVGSATAIHTATRSLFETRISWGAVTNPNVSGPTFATDPTGSGSMTLGLEFYVLWSANFVGCRIYKAPNCAGTVPVYLWDSQGTGGSPRQLGTTTVTWVADAGGWQDITFSSPIPLTPNVLYVCSYWSPTSDHAFSDNVFAWWSDVVTPLTVNAYTVSGTGVASGGSCNATGSVQQFPVTHVPGNYYIEPKVTWTLDSPVFVPDTNYSYFRQWVNGVPNHPFMIGVFFSDPQYLSDYAAMGVNTLIAGYGTPDYVDAVKTAGMDHYPFVSLVDDPERLALRSVSEDPAYGALVRGYLIMDEPDQYFPYTPPTTLIQWFVDLRLIDSTRPTLVDMGRVVGINQDFTHQPQGSTMDQVNVLWRQWAALPDILGGDFYTLTPDNDPTGLWGVWTYAPWTRRLRNLNEGTTPVWVAVETTSGTPNLPVPEDVRKAIWACLIAGANGIVLFDHRFASALVTQDFAAMLHDPAMKAMMTTLISRIMSLANALNSPNTNLVTGWTSSNTTSGPLGGTYGVPMHYCTKTDGTHQYLFAMSIRPGATTATFTIPAWAGRTVTVLDESRTVTVNGSGVLTDSFAADYTTHLYQL